MRVLVAAGSVLAVALGGMPAAEAGVPCDPGVLGAPALSPDGAEIVFVQHPCAPAGVLYVGSTAGDDVAPPLELAVGQNFLSDPRWSPGGGWIAVTAATTPAKIDVIHPYASVLKTIAVGSGPDWSPDGSRLAFTGPDGTVRVVSADGFGERVLAAGADPAWSPDGSRLAFVAAGGSLETIGADGADALMVTDGAEPGRPAWSPDGKEIAYASADGIAVVTAVGIRVLTSRERYEGLLSWSSDGTSLLVGEGDVVDVASGTVRRPYPQEDVVAAGAQWDELVVAVPAPPVYAPPDLYVTDARGGHQHQVSPRRCATLASCGTDGPDVLRAPRGPILGGAGNDRLVGGPGPNRLEGSFGNDVLIGGGGEDFIYGQAGNDRIVGGGRYSVVDGGPGTDRIDDRRGYSNWIFGRSGRDVIVAGRGEVVHVDGDGARDVVRCAGTGDHVYADRGDVVRGRCRDVFRRASRRGR